MLLVTHRRRADRVDSSSKPRLRPNLSRDLGGRDSAVTQAIATKRRTHPASDQGTCNRSAIRRSSGLGAGDATPRRPARSLHSSVQNLPAAKKSRGGLSPKFKAAIGTATSVTIVLALIGLRVYLRSERRADRNQEPETQQQIVENQTVSRALRLNFWIPASKNRPRTRPLR